MIYVAGADPYIHDQLGGLSLTQEGLKERDRVVMELALSQHVPVAITLAGGYSKNMLDTIKIHCNTVMAAKECLLDIGWPDSG